MEASERRHFHSGIAEYDGAALGKKRRNFGVWEDEFDGFGVESIGGRGDFLWLLFGGEGERCYLCKGFAGRRGMGCWYGAPTCTETSRRMGTYRGDRRSVRWDIGNEE